MNILKAPLSGGGASDSVVAGVGYTICSKNTPLRPSQEGNRTALAFARTNFILKSTFFIKPV
jgi:hypothetical protein